MKHWLLLVCAAAAVGSAVMGIAPGCIWAAEEAPRQGAAAAAGSITLVADGQGKAVIVLAADASASVKESARLLSGLILESSGAEIPVGSLPAGDAADAPVVIHVGADDYARAAGLKIDKLDDDGFVIAFPDSRNIVIAGGSDFGTKFGVCEFLERYVGVRWLFPGKLGRHVPQKTTLTIPTREVRQEPAFLSRLLSLGSKAPRGTRAWTRLNREHGRVRFHHNLKNLYRPSEYAKSHPHFFPIRNGKRYFPTDKAHDWQPVLTTRGIVAEGVKNICAYFDEHPEATSYSLGMNDNNKFSAPEKKRNSLGIADFSDHYFGWANKVSKGVSRKYPGKWLGCLAYSGTTDPPSFAVSPQIVPYICFDRMQWYSATRADFDKARTRKWSKMCPMLGWYDYIYGDQAYRVPRVYFHLMARYLRFAHKNGVKCYYAEAYPAPKWTEGPKLYLTLRLLWNPYLDVDQTLDDWYQCAVGKDAAPHLKTYFSFWEQFWAKRATKTPWFGGKKGGRVYLKHHSRGYLEALKKGELSKCQDLLSKVVAESRTDSQKARAKFFMAGFQKMKKNLGSVGPGK